MNRDDYTYRLSHSVGQCLYHFVFVCKYRRKHITEALARDIRLFFHQAAEEIKAKVSAVEVGNDEGDTSGDYNHVHVLINAPQTLSPSKIASRLKSRTTLWVRKAYSMFKEKELWSSGYFVSTISLGSNLDAVIAYIENQQDKE